MADPLVSSEAFIKALKGSSDPIYEGGPTKIELAAEAFTRSSLYIPAKREIIAEWILSKLFKERKAEKESNPCLNHRFWRLLSAIVTSNDQPSSSKAISLWLDPLLLRYPLLALTSAVIRHATSAPDDVLQEGSTAMRNILACSTIKPTYDSAWELFSETISSLANPGEHGGWFRSEAAESLIVLCVEVCQTVLAESSNKKKTLTAFVNGPIDLWITAQSQLLASPSSRVSPQLAETVSAVLFAPETLRQQIPAWTTGDDKAPSMLDRLFQTRTDHMPVLNVLPTIFQSFVREGQRNRSAVTPSGASAENLSPKVRAKRACTAFLGSCMKCIESSRSVDLKSVWAAKGRLLSVLEEENLFQSDDEVAHSMLSAQCKSVTDVLSAVDDPEPELIDSLFLVLTVLINLDYALLEATLPVIFRVLAKIPRRTRPLQFLSLHLTYHIKTRTLQDVVSLLCDTLADPTHAQNSYKQFSLSCLGERDYASNLSNAIARYLTPSQVVPTVSEMLKTLESAWSLFNAARSDSDQGGEQAPDTRKSKKRRLSKEGDGDILTRSQNSSGILMASATRVVAVMYIARLVLLSLPLGTVSKEALSELGRVVRTVRTNVVLPAITLVLSAQSRDPGRRGGDLGKGSLENHIVCAAALRFAYALQGSVLWGLDLSVTDNWDVVIVGEEAVELLRGGNILPELRVELVRTVLQHHSRDDMSSPLLKVSAEFFPILLATLSSRRDKVERASWDGLFSSLDGSPEGEAAADLAIWELLLDRWLSIVDAFAPLDLLNYITEVMLRHGTEVLAAGNSSQLTISAICQRAMHSADFWEMPHIRPVILSGVAQKCNVLKPIAIDQALEMPLTTSSVSQEQVSQAIQALHFVLQIPAEYLDKTTRSVIVQTTLVADILRYRLGTKRSPSTSTAATREAQARDHIVLRTLLFHIIQESGKLDLLTSTPSLIQHLSTSAIPFSVHGSDKTRVRELTMVSLKLLGLFYSSAANSASKGEHGLLETCLAQQKSLANSWPLSESLALEIRCTVQLLSTLSTTAGLDFTRLPSETANLCQALHRQVKRRISSALKNVPVVLEDTNAADEVMDIVGLAEKLVRIDAWLNSERETEVNVENQSYIRALIKTLLAYKSPAGEPDRLPDLCLAVLAFAMQALSGVGGRTATEKKTVEEALAAFVVVMRLMDFTDWSRAGPLLARLSKSLSSDTYAHALALIQKNLGNTGHDRGRKNKEDILFAFLLSGLIRNSPEGSFKINQEYTTRCFEAIARISTPEDSSALSSSLTIVLDLTSDKSASLKNADVASILTILGHALAGGPTHQSSTTGSIYENIVAVLLALVRLRRDLVANVLPHFSFLSSRLCDILRSVRPELGARQRRAVTDTMPFWIQPTQPLGSESAKSLARLLTNLRTKTIVRSGASAQVQGQLPDSSAPRAQSLAQPFSKHAPYVVTAYIRALVDPLSVISPRVRQELEPGLFALCEMMGEYGRDAIMTAMLDDSGKAMMKLLWVEYDKQRYVGKG